MNTHPEIPAAESPEKLSKIRLTRPDQKAAGWPAIFSTVSYLLSAMSISRGFKALQALNQKNGYDCPGCAWPDPDDERSALGEYCENGAKAIAEEATTKKIDAAFFRQHSVADLSRLSDFEIGKKGRLAEPLYLPVGASHYQSIGWEEAFQKIGDHLNALDSPDEAVFYTSGRTSNEAAFLYQLFVRQYGTNNLPDCSNMCHESSGVALTEALGIGKGSVKLEDFYEAEVILILGQNPGTNHPRMLTALQKAKQKGAIIISINPLPEAGLISFSNPQTLKGLMGLTEPLTDLFLQVKINGDLALIKAIILLLLQKEEAKPGAVFDQSFIQQHTTGAEAFLEDVRSYSLEKLVELSGVSPDLIHQASDILSNKTRIIACWAMGLTQHKNAVDTIRELVNLLLLKGSIGKPGAGTCPVRGHSNVQGDRTMGIYEKPSAAFLDALKNRFGFEPPRKEGYDTVEAIHAMHSGKAKVFMAMGGNFLSATPDTLFTAEALRKCRLTVHVSTKLNRSHLVHGQEALILPCLARSDRDNTGNTLQFVSCENSMGVVQTSKGNLNPVSEQLLSEPAIICRMAKETLKERTTIDWDRYLTCYDLIREDIENVIPGFETYNERVRQPGGFYLPNANREKRFTTLTGLATFHIAAPVTTKLEEEELMMMTIRSHDQFNTTIYGMDDRYRGVRNERRVLFINEKDMKKRGFAAGMAVDLVNNEGGRERIARNFLLVPYPIPENCTASYFPETNVLVPISNTAIKSNTPVSKLVVIRIRKHQPETSTNNL